MFGKQFEIPASHSPSGKKETFEAHHDSTLTAYLRYIIACCDFLRHFNKFDGHFVGTIEIMKANFPWVTKRHTMTGYRYWVFSGFHIEGLIIIHSSMSKHESIGTMTHELMHYFYERFTHKPERYIQKKAIENIVKIIQNYDLITHPNNEKNFHQYGITSNLLSLNDLKAVLKYLEVTLPHLF
ncbi:MAG: hypothetical protein JXC36_03665 [Candidatus Atribacteria bacterium]|nr:hypothetical protein [Candidatus Atribacteria bacterium]